VKSPGLYGDLTRCRIGLSSVVFYCREALIFQKIILVVQKVDNPTRRRGDFDQGADPERGAPIGSASEIHALC
jgi:hypothetical protein